MPTIDFTPPPPGWNNPDVLLKDEVKKKPVSSPRKIKRKPKR